MDNDPDEDETLQAYIAELKAINERLALIETKLIILRLQIETWNP